MKIGIINDEISDDLEEAFYLSKKHSLDYISLRTQDKKNVFHWNENLWKKSKKLSCQYEIPIHSISSPFFKSSFLDNPYYQSIDYPLPVLLDDDIIDIFEHWLSKAIRCNPKVIRIFSPVDSKEINETNITKWKSILNKALNIAYKNNIVLAIENEPVCYLSDSKKTSLFVTNETKENLMMIWDPGNDLSRKNFDSTFIPNNISEIHLKDWAILKNEWVTLGNGDLPIKDILKKININSNITIETHVGKNKSEKLITSINSIIYLKKMILNNSKENKKYV